MTDRANSTHLGRPNYTGPDEGWGGYVHHDQQVEYCWSFQKRITMIQRDKPVHEQAVRLACLTYLGPAPLEVEQAGQAYEQAAQAALTPKVFARLLARLAELTTEAPWNGTVLVFKKGRP